MSYENEFQEIPVAELHESPMQPRFFMARSIIQSFMSAIEVAGGVFPRNKAVTVRPRPEGGFEILEGHHRTAAAKEAGLATVWAFVKDVDDREAMLYLAASNSQRSLAPVEHGRQALRAKELGVDVAEYARRIGKAPESVYNYVRAYQVLARFGGVEGPYVNVGHVTLAALAAIEDVDLQGKALFQIHHRKLTDVAGKAVVAALKEGKPLWKALEGADGAHKSSARGGGGPGFGDPTAPKKPSPDPIKTIGLIVEDLVLKNNDVHKAARYTLALYQARAEALEERFGAGLKGAAREAFHEEVAERHRKLLAELEIEEEVASA